MASKLNIPKGMIVYFIICVLALIWPGALLANRIEPTVWGLPFMFFWYILWIFILFIGFVICYILDSEGEENE